MSAPDTKDDQSYEVGYGRPPKHTRWQKGQSGNRNGRPAGTKNLKTIIEEELNAQIVVTENGRQRRISRQQAMVIGQIIKATKGDTRAFAAVLKLVIQFMDDDEGRDEKHLSDDEEAALERMLARLGRQSEE
jgi:hypothetical protein